MSFGLPFIAHRSYFVVSICCCRADRGACVVLGEFFKSPLANCPTDVRHQPLVESDIMHGNQHGSKHLAGEKKVPDGAARERSTSIAVAAGFDRSDIPGEPRISN